MEVKRYLVITADDLGIGPDTSRGIIDLARLGKVTSSVLVVNSPYAEPAIKLWQNSKECLEIGWHVCLTLDRPVLPPGKVSTLVDNQGRFFPLGTFLRKLFLGHCKPAELQAEIAAQYRRFIELTGSPPRIVNGHHHIHILPEIEEILRNLLSKQTPPPYLRRVWEPWSLWARIHGTRGKRLLLNLLGQRCAQRQSALGFAGNDVLIGLGNPNESGDLAFFTRWIKNSPGKVVELMCHPGYLDEALLGRDAKNHQELNFRYQEWQRLLDPAFSLACQEAGFTLVATGELFDWQRERQRYAA